MNTRMNLPLRGYVIGVIILLGLLAVMIALGVGIGILVASFADTAAARPIGAFLGGLIGFASGVGACSVLVEFAVQFVRDRKKCDGLANK
jgi:F0F1-type ATP synthase assembly protein I